MACAAAAAKKSSDRDEAYASALLAVVEAATDYIRMGKPAVGFSAYVRAAATLGACEAKRNRTRSTANNAKYKRVLTVANRVRRRRSDVGLSKTQTFSEATEEMMILTNDDYERELLNLKIMGCTNSEAADKLGVNPSTVGRYLEAVELRRRRRETTEKIIECGIPNT